MKRPIYTLMLSVLFVMPLLNIQMVLGTSIETCISQATLDGEIYRWGRPYPPTQYTGVHTDYDSINVGQFRDIDGTEPGYLYAILRGYVSFDTSSIPDHVYVQDLTLILKTRSDFSITDFTLEVWGGELGNHDIYGSSLDSGDWGCGKIRVGNWDTASGAGEFVEIHISDLHVNKTGRTQFELKSSREGTCPTADEYISFYSGDSPGNEPRLEVTFSEGGVPGGRVDEKFAKQTYTSTLAGLYHDGDEVMAEKDIYAVYLILQDVWYIEQGNHDYYILDLQLTLELPDVCTERKHGPTHGNYGSSPVSYSLSISSGFGLGSSVSITPPRYQVDYHRETNNGKLKATWNAYTHWSTRFGWFGIGRLYDDTVSFFLEFECPQGYKPVVGVKVEQGIYYTAPATPMMPPIQMAKFKCTEDTGWLILDPPDSPPLTLDPPPPLTSPDPVYYPTSINSYNVYYSDTAQNLTSLIRGYTYYAKVQFSWYSNATCDEVLTSDAVLTALVRDAQGQTVANVAVQYTLDYGNYTETLSFVVDQSAYTGTGTLQITLSNKQLGTPDCFDIAFPIVASIAVSNGNNAPNSPSTPSGPLVTYKDTTCSYSTGAVDPDGDNVQYEIDWGDGTVQLTSWYASDATAIMSHSWNTLGTYEVQVRATDVYSVWSGISNLSVAVVTRPGGGCPILHVKKDGEYVSEGLLDIHNPDGTDVVTSHILVHEPDRVKNAYLFKLVEHPQTISNIDQVKLFAILEDGTMEELPLIWAWHSERGNVISVLRFSDDLKAETKGADHNNGTSQSVELRFAALSSHLNPVTFVFVIEGNNPGEKEAW